MRRAIIAGLWFAAFLFAHEVAWSVFGSPRPLGLVVGFAAAAFVLLDPFGIVDRQPADRTVERDRSMVGEAIARLEGAPKG